MGRPCAADVVFMEVTGAPRFPGEVIGVSDGVDGGAAAKAPEPAGAPAHLAVFDGLRGLAVVMVVAFHATKWTGFRLVYPRWPQDPVVSVQTFATTGYLGVELFFFISGFVLFYPFVRHKLEGTRQPGWIEYAYRRFIKIVPSYMLALAAASLIHRADFSNGAAFQKEVIAHVFFLHGFSEYSIVTIEDVFWSLAVEVQFYFVFPLIVLAFIRWPLATWITACAAALAYREYHIWNNTFEHFLINKGLPAEIDVFVTGMMGAYLFVRGRAFFGASEEARKWATAAALVAIVGTVFLFQSLADIHQADTTHNIDFYRDELLWQIQHRTLIMLLYMALALGSAFGLTFWRRIVANPVLVWLSVVSYNLYLWHQPIMTLCYRNGFPCALDPKPWLRNGWQEQFFAVSILLSLAVATVVTYAFERPLLRLRPAWLRKVGVPAPRVHATAAIVPPGGAV